MTERPLKPKERLKKHFWALFVCWLPALLTCVFVIGFRFDYLWAAFLNTLVLLYWPVLLPVALEIDYRKQLKNYRENRQSGAPKT